jgi:hypothetical protein
MLPIAFFLSVAATVTPMISDIILFGSFFGITVVMFAAALMRQTIITALFSSVLWFALSFAVWNFGEATSSLTQGSSIAFMGLGTVMLIVTFHFMFERFSASAAEKQRQVAEEVL